MSDLQDGTGVSTGSFNQQASRHAPRHDAGSLGATSLQRFALPEGRIDKVSHDRSDYETWINSLVEDLSPEGQALVSTEFLQHLRRVPHSTIAHSGLFNHVDLTRFDHSVHAAHSVSVLNANGRLGLSPYEAKVLELTLLLHDPHRLGSHALDRLFASMPGAPKDFNSWWPANDFHEYHGALAVAKDPELREILGECHADVVAILTRDDRRHQEEQERDYGPLRGKLSDTRVAALKRLEDELDRCSYLKLDYLRSGFSPHVVAQAIADVTRHEHTLTAHASGIQLNITEQSGARPYDDVAQWRRLYRAELATLPVGCLAEQVIFHTGVWNQAKTTHPREYLLSEKFYEDTRDKALAGKYHEMFSPDALSLLNAARSGNGLCIEDVHAPLITLTLADIEPSKQQSYLDTYVPHGLAEELCGVPRKDMTIFESFLRNTLRDARIPTNIYVLTSNDFGKTLEYAVSRGGNPPTAEKSQTMCDKCHIKLVVAARAIDEAGQPIDLSSTQEVLASYLKKSPLLRNPNALQRFNPNIFCELVTPEHFSDAIRAKIEGYQPAWIRLGGSGLL